ncbi:37564_t:CDS:2, partial [Gigaspora margarita]
MRSNTNNNSGRSETFDPLYKVLLYKKKDIIAIQEKFGYNTDTEGLGINGNPILEVAFRSNEAHEASIDILIEEIHNLLLCLEEDIITIQDELGIIGYSNQERVEEANENTRAYFRKFEKFHSPLEDDPGVVLENIAKWGKRWTASDH